MLRIIYFSRDYTTHDHRFLTALARSEYQVYFLQLERRGHALEDRPIPEGIERIHWAGGQKPATLLTGSRLLSDLRRVLRQVQPDLVHAGPLQRSAFLVALAGYRPLVSMSWGYDLIHDAHRNIFWRWATRYTLRRSTLMVGDCEPIRKLAVTYGMPSERIITFPWGVDLQHFSPASTANEAQPFTMLSTRGWEPIYGVDVIAKAFVQAAQCQPSLRLIMLGNGSLAGMLRQTFQKGGVEDRVLFPGQVTQTDLPRYFRLADLYVSASHSDGASISLLEALACGKPALVSDIPGNLEWVTPGENGWWFTDGDVGSLAEGILNAVEQREQLPVMGITARRIAEQRADWEKNFPRLLEGYKFALNQAHNS